MKEVCYTENAILKKGAKKYVYGTNLDAGKLFWSLVALGIDVEGFIEESTEECGIVFRKPTLFRNMITDKNIQILSLDKSCKNDEVDIIDYVIELKEEINKEKIVIYGAGHVGEIVGGWLLEQGVNILCYIDSNPAMCGKNIHGVRICEKDVLRTLPSDVTVIIAGKYWKEIDAIVEKENPFLKRYHEDGMIENLLNNGKYILIDCKSNLNIPIRALASMIEHYSNKGIILYCTDEIIALRLADLYRLIGFEDIKIAMDNPADDKCGSYPMINIVDALYEENNIVLIQDKYQEKRLQELGMREMVDYAHIRCCNLFSMKEPAFDVNLGHAFLSGNDKSQDPTVCIYGEALAEDYKIAVLGGSTTQGSEVLAKSWPQLMYERNINKGVTIYNYGNSGYVSGQELLKMLRDVIAIRPDMILVYSGVNDIHNDMKSEFDFVYLQSIVEKLKGQKVISGVEEQLTNAERWIRNVRYMNAIANVENIDFYAFVQPNLLNKTDYTLHEKEIIRMFCTMYDEKMFYKSRDMKRNAEKWEKEYSYVYDFSDIFDDADVYFDYCHVYEEGNIMIADKIWNVIKDNVSKAMMK